MPEAAEAKSCCSMAAEICSMSEEPAAGKGPAAEDRVEEEDVEAPEAALPVPVLGVAPVPRCAVLLAGGAVPVVVPFEPEVPVPVPVAPDVSPALVADAPGAPGATGGGVMRRRSSGTESTEGREERRRRRR